VRFRIGGIAELIDIERAHLGCDAFGHILVVLGVSLADIRAREYHFGSERAQIEDFLACHLVGHHERQLVAFLRSDQCQAEARVARGGFYDSAARLELAVALGRLDHGQADAIFDRAAGILALELDEQATHAARQMRDLEQRGVSDQVQEAVRGHRLVAVNEVDSAMHALFQLRQGQVYPTRAGASRSSPLPRPFRAR
jgi:hypothetical protein